MPSARGSGGGVCLGGEPFRPQRGGCAGGGRGSGLTATVVLADAAIISALVLAQQHLVPAVMISDNTTWMLPLACTSVYVLQIALRPRLGLPRAGIVVIAYGLGPGHPADAWLLVVETVVAAGLVAVIRGGARQADAVVAASLET